MTISWTQCCACSIISLSHESARSHTSSFRTASVRLSRILIDDNEKRSTMRILHTADWHMQYRLGRQDRSEHIHHALEQIAGYLQEHSVDVMLVAGDIFS